MSMNQNNISLEKVINGLDCCLEGLCEPCEYRGSKGPGGCKDELMCDALTLLKAQEPRVLTLAELEHAEVAYAEDIDKDEIIPILVNGRQYDRFNMVRARLGNSPSGVFRPSIFDYNKRWRCWTSKPTNKQRQETKWV